MRMNDLEEGYVTAWLTQPPPPAVSSYWDLAQGLMTPRIKPEFVCCFQLNCSSGCLVRFIRASARSVTIAMIFDREHGLFNALLQRK